MSTLPADTPGEDEPRCPPSAKPQPQEQDGPYTAVVYVHGMGSQKRYEEVSHLVDALDDYAFGQSALITDVTKKDYLKGILAYTEKTATPNENISYIRVSHKPAGKQSHELKPYRFHEVYWAPVTAGGAPPRAVFYWLLQQVSKPWQILRTPWRDRQRYRRAILHRMRTDLQRTGRDPFLGDDLQLLVKAYHNFERPEFRHKGEAGSFRNFEIYLGNLPKEQLTQRDGALAPDQKPRLIRLARLWWWSCLRREVINAFVLVTIALALVLGVAFVAQVAAMLLHFLYKDWGPWLETFTKIPNLSKRFEPSTANIGMLVGIALGLIKFRSFLQDYLGDVQFWSTYEETDEKHKKHAEIVNRTTATIQHVLIDLDCRRVVIVAHSLGASVAYDGLLALGRMNQTGVTEWTDADQLRTLPRTPLPLDKIDTFITMGNPVDKVHYFFESHKGPNHRYIRVVDQVRGDMGKVPFATQTCFDPELPWSGHGTALIRWVNFWDEADIISGPQYTPANWWNADLTVDNVHSRSYLFPNPNKCHGGYFHNADVIQHLYAMIFNAPESRALRVEAPKIGPGRFYPLTRRLQGACMVLLWIIVFHLIVKMLGFPLLTIIAIIAEIVLAAIIGIALLCDRGPLNPLIPTGHK